MTATSSCWSSSELRNAVAAGDVRLLMMVLVHLTGDLRWLEPPFRPGRDIRLIPDPSAGLPRDVQAHIREAAVNAIATIAVPAIVDPGEDLMHRMMETCLGETVAREYANLNREEMGLKDRFLEPISTKSESTAPRVLIIGAGVSGISLAVTLKKLSVPFLVVEKLADVGGTWLCNRYPGSGVDTPNHAYSYSFGARHLWSRYFSPREEVHDYLRSVVREYDLRPHIRFNTMLERTHWDEGAHVWRSVLRGASGDETMATQFFVSAIGQFSEPAIPQIEGAQNFGGTILHSMDWPEDLKVDGRTVAVIGSGATAMQLVPAIAGRASQVDVYQRTPQWSRPIQGYADAISPQVQQLLARVPFYEQWFRFSMFWRYGDGLLRYLKKDPHWPHPERAVNAANDRHREEMTAFIRDELQGRPDLLEGCVPTYPPYGKRILLDNNWYRTLRRPDVELVTEPISRITRDGIELSDGSSRPAEIVVYATGFRLGELAARLNVTGRRGLTLAHAWGGGSGPSAYLGLAVPGFPNFFSMLGPGSAPAHGGSVVFQAECQSRFIASCISQMARDDVTAIAVRFDVADAYERKFDSEHESLIWSHPGMTTYYRNPAGRVFSIMPWRFVDYWRYTHDADLSEFEQLAAHSANLVVAK